MFARHTRNEDNGSTTISTSTSPSATIFRDDQTDLLSVSPVFQRSHYDLLISNPPSYNPDFISRISNNNNNNINNRDCDDDDETDTTTVVSDDITTTIKVVDINTGNMILLCHE